MPDLVFVRANPNQPVKEGNAVVIIGPALPTGAAIGDVGHQAQYTPSGQAGFAQSVLSTRMRHWNYYEGVSGEAPDNPTTPTF